MVKEVAAPKQLKEGASDLLVQLEHLGKLREQGVLPEEEFMGAKEADF